MKRYLLEQLLALAEPLGFAWACTVILAAVFALRRKWRAATAVAVPALILLVFGGTDVPGWFVRQLERPYVGTDIAALPRADAIVLLGGGARPARFEVADMHLTGSGDRIIMGMELARLGKAPVLVVGGSAAEFPDRTVLESETVRRWLVERALVPCDVIALPACANTRDEASFVRDLAAQHGWQRVLLVTSANHMRRAVATFRTAGVSVVPAPCNFLTKLSQPPPPYPIPCVPTGGSFEKMGTWLHEQIGWLEYRRRGWIDPAMQ